MFFEGQTQEALRAMREKRFLMEHGLPHEHIRILGVICGGVKKGVTGGGTVTAWHEQGYGKVFHVLACFSTGGPTGGYFMSGSPRVGTTIYAEECCTKAFFDPLRFHEPCDVGYLVHKVFRNSHKQMDVGRVLAHPSKLVIAVTHYETGEQHFFTPESEEDLLILTQATISMPGLCTTPVWFRGERYVDGAAVEPLPLQRLIDLHQPTHVIVIANRARSLHAKTSLFEVLLNEVVFRRRISPALWRAIRSRRDRMSTAFRWALSESPVPVMISWGDSTVGNFTQDPAKLRSAAERSRVAWVEALRRGHE